MNLQANNKVVCDIRKVQWAKLWYKNQYGDTKNGRPSIATVMGQSFSLEHLRFGSNQTMFDYAKEHKLLDVWTPVLKLQFASNHSLTYEGDKALSIYKAWCEYIFNRKK